MTYILYGSELSYFTRKLEAALQFQQVPFRFERRQPDNAEELKMRSGTHQIPVMATPENWLLADTTPIIDLLDSRFPLRRMFPGGLPGVLVHVLEEYFDEWIARTMVHYRWHYERSAVFAAERMSGGDAEGAARLRGWGPRACRATGTDSPVQQRAAEAEYLRLLTAMEQQLGQTRYLLGDRPTAVDCVVLGGLRAHTHMDPDPKAVTATFPRVVAFSEGERDDWDGGGELAPFPESTAFARLVLGELAGPWQRYTLGNRDAQRAGAKAFSASIYSEDVSFLARPYPERSRQMIVARLRQRLTDDERQRILRWAGDLGIAAALQA